MKRIPWIPLFSVVILATTSPRAAAAYALEGQLYVFKNSDVHAIRVGAANPETETGAVVLRSPSTASFDHETLSLRGSEFTWSGGINPPPHFSLIRIPEMRMSPGKPSTLLSSTPVVYLERNSRGALQSVLIDRDSPAAPHCRMTFTAEPASANGDRVKLTSDLDIATVASRDAVAGLPQPVGKPVLAEFKETVSSVVRENEWSGIYFRSAKGAPYSLLMLLRAKSTLAEPASPAMDPEAQARMTVADIDDFITNYYQHPDPDRIGTAIAAMGSRTYASLRQREIRAGFFAEVFADNPTRVPGWRKLIATRDRTVRDRFAKIFALPWPSVLNESKDASIAANYMMWGGFFASGKTKFLQLLAERLPLIDSDSADPFWRSRDDPFWVGATAMQSLADNGPTHPEVYVVLKNMRATADTRTAELIADLLTKDARTVRSDISQLRRGEPPTDERPWDEVPHRDTRPAESRIIPTHNSFR